MQKVKVIQFITVTLGFISVVLTQPPLYSAQYAKIRYQPEPPTSQVRKGKLNLGERHREDVTEKSHAGTGAIHQNDNERFSSAEFSEVTTEQQSEQINFASFTHSRVIKDKLQKENVEFQTRASAQESTTYLNDELDSTQVNVKTDYKDEVAVEDDTELLDDSSYSELSDLNEQGVYYIIHPNGLFQKVVYKTFDEPQNMQISTQLEYENIEPIIEPVYTYDPRTFVFQRLLLRANPNL